MVLIFSVERACALVIKTVIRFFLQHGSIRRIKIRSVLEWKKKHYSSNRQTQSKTRNCHFAHEFSLNVKKHTAQAHHSVKVWCWESVTLFRTWTGAIISANRYSINKTDSFQSVLFDHSFGAYSSEFTRFSSWANGTTLRNGINTILSHPFIYSYYIVFNQSISK